MRDLPPEAFPGPQHKWQKRKCCKECNLVGADRQQRLIRQTKLDGEIAIKNFIAKIRENRIEAPHVTELCAEMIKRFGGLVEFTIQYHRQILAAEAAKPGSKNVLDAYKAVTNLIHLSTQNRRTAPDAAELTDEEIEAEILQLAPRLLPAPQVVDADYVREPTEQEPAADDPAAA